MRNIRLEIEYDGTDYCGWQTQTRNKNRLSIQETLEKTLQKILQEKVRIVGSGRTDAGVHAQQQVANFKTNSNIALNKLQKALNSLLPDDIVIMRAREVPLEFHSRYSVKSKRYRYTILNRAFPCALLRHFVYFYPYRLDVARMKKAARYLVGRYDFSSFMNAGSKRSSAVRTVRELAIKKEADYIYIDIEADGFLYTMVRSIIGTLIEVGRGKLGVYDVRKILKSRDRRLAGPTAPARALSLIAVSY